MWQAAALCYSLQIVEFNAKVNLTLSYLFVRVGKVYVPICVILMWLSGCLFIRTPEELRCI